MRKLFAISLALVMLAGCGKKPGLATDEIEAARERCAKLNGEFRATIRGDGLDSVVCTVK